MSKILLIGHIPPPLLIDIKVEASNYRTWQFLEPLLVDGHTVCLCADEFNLDPIQSQLFVPPNWAGQLSYFLLSIRGKTSWVKQLQQIHDTFEPDCIIAVNFDCCLYATKLRTNIPVWMDIYGDYLTIMQASGFRQFSDRGIQTSISYMRRVLKKGDVFSGCSLPQQHMLVGELAMVGRLKSRTFGYHFSHVVLPGSPSKNQYSDNHKGKHFFAEHNIPDESFVVLWCGSYNTWTDVDTLFTGLELAMEGNVKLHFISVGANSYEGPDNVYTRFLTLIAQSKYKERFHMLGWRPWAEMEMYYQVSNLGINIDALHYETIYGTRTRLVEMLSAGLPIITSTGCELSKLIGDYGAGLVFDSGNSQDMGKQILSLSNNNVLYNALVDKALQMAQNELSFYNTTTPVRAWVNQPQRAPDNISTNISHKMKNFEYQIRSIIRQLLWTFFNIEK